MYKVVFFDFGGVIAEEGWEQGLKEIAEAHGFYPPMFFDDACDVLWSTGYMYGRAVEETFWSRLSERYRFNMTADEMRQIIFDRFVIRHEVLDLVDEISEKGYRTAILSDQTNWLSEFNLKYGIFEYFDRIFNSYDLGIGKKDQRVFPLVCKEMGIEPADALFVDDNAGHIERAQAAGLGTVHFTDPVTGMKTVRDLLGI